MPLPTLQIASPDGNTVAEFVPGAAMLCRSLTYREQEHLDPGKGLDAYVDRGATMGIPLLYPWANRLAEFGYRAAGKDVSLPDDRHRIPADPNGLPIHGVVPSLLEFATRSGESALSASLRWDSEELLELFPFRHELRVDVSVAGGELTWATTVSATGGDRVPVSFGFHPYLRIPDSSRASWQLQLPAAEHLSLDEQMIPTGERHPAPDGELALGGSSWDDGFAPRSLPARYAARSPEGGVALELLEGFPFSQIYAPPGKDFICFEPMTAPTNALRSADGLTVLEPGTEYRAVFRVVVLPGSG